MAFSLADVAAWKTATALALAMFAGGAAGWWRGWIVRGKDHEACTTTFDGAVISLLGLLLAFTFSMALMKHEGRRQAAVADGNAIGDFFSCAGLLDEPTKGRLKTLIRRYVELRLIMARPSIDEAAFEGGLDQIQVIEGEMHVAVDQAVRGGTPVIVPLVTTYNSMTSSHASRLAAVRDHLPPHVVLLLVVAAVLSVVLMGKRYGAEGEWRPAALAGYIAVVCLAVWVTLDLDQPRRGLVTVSQEPIERLLKNIRE
jgi:hypothetical protein